MQVINQKIAIEAAKLARETGTSLKQTTVALLDNDESKIMTLRFASTKQNMERAGEAGRAAARVYRWINPENCHRLAALYKYFFENPSKFTVDFAKLRLPDDLGVRLSDLGLRPEAHKIAFTRGFFETVAKGGSYDAG
jgi:hypothetical protein